MSPKNPEEDEGANARGSADGSLDPGGGSVLGSSALPARTGAREAYSTSQLSAGLSLVPSISERVSRNTRYTVCLKLWSHRREPAAV